MQAGARADKHIEARSGTLTNVEIAAHEIEEYGIDKCVAYQVETMNAVVASEHEAFALLGPLKGGECPITALCNDSGEVDAIDFVNIMPDKEGRAVLVMRCL